MFSNRRLVCACVAAILVATCSTLEYDFSTVSIPVRAIPVSAKPVSAGVVKDPLHIERKSVLWTHGLFGQSSPDVASLLKTVVIEGQLVRAGSLPRPER